jgi:hypothetical protein
LLCVQQFTLRMHACATQWAGGCGSATIRRSADSVARIGARIIEQLVAGQPLTMAR